MSAITYYVGTGQPAFNTATTASLPVWEDVIPELNAKLVFNQQYMQLAVSYSPLALNTQYPAQGTAGVPASPTYYLVSEFGHSDEKAGLIKWTRQYACVPDSWSETQEYAMNYPGYAVPISIGTPYNITAITSGSSTTFYQVSFTTSALAVGDPVYISVSYARAGATYAVALYTRVSHAATGDFVGIPYILPGTGVFTGISGSIQYGAPGRAAGRTEIVGSRIVNDYALATPETLESVLPLVNGFQPVDIYGNVINYLLTGTATRPNSESYQKWVTANAEIVAETSSRERWKGNIFVRRTRLVPAK